MKKDPRQVRLPELPLIKKYSLAVRQEFASAQEVLALLQRSVSKVEAALARSEADLEDSQEDGRGPFASSEPDEAISDLQETASDVMPDLPFEADRWDEHEPPRDSKAPAKEKPKSRASRVTPKPSVVRVSHLGAPIDKKRKPKAASRKPKPVSRSKPKAAPRRKTVSRSKPKPVSRSKPKKTARRPTKRGRR